ncbi:DNA (cytosine-5)-methyltransferase 1 [Limimaricola soesokkakensis]|uniref:Cytosine-specific methyltransferase n=1 Tax=Limimaricola soesokkakensis TaxID=1343159 RepID=A0A1X6ZRY3_9RHOB|nr:DNA (cytosine-5-)-methyltransferase [Limimaricola soesokkakensis]PSK84059.1 DNA (cytosine-5)-methyltransferase 1 [Limimaricola soesokkakensis]SLN59679.1 Modification methylase BspRI [Limimaricola soesokkakensis]
MLDAETQQAVQPKEVSATVRPMIDLFAGCGGLSLGFEQAGFTPVFVNELNDDARQTYLLNRPHFVGGQRFNDMPNLASADVHSLNRERLQKLESDLKGLDKRLAFGKDGTIDVLAGGPPCQGFSGLGHRRSYSVDKALLPSNQLYDRMAAVIEHVQPRIFLFENVRGLLFSKWTSQGKKGDIWNDVYDRFKRLEEEYGYSVRWKLVLASDYGVPQNRPRVLVVGVRNDVAKTASAILDVGADEDDAYACNFLPRHGLYPVPDLVDLLSDLEDPAVRDSLHSQDFPKPFQTGAYISEATTPVQRYLRPGELGNAGAQVTEQEYSRHAKRIVTKFQAMIENGGEIPEEFKTKKFAQKVLPARWGNKPPSITATSMPDDYVHYRQPRTLTVREWARLQTFPDWYQFAGKRTTGGLRRAGNPREGLHDREVPKYTQIGNAVPVRLAEAVASHFDKILTEAGFPAGG